VTGLDTNVLVRYVMQDDPKQGRRAREVIEAFTAETPGFVTIVAIVEFVWVLSSCYELTKPDVIRAVEVLIRSKEIVIEAAEVVVRAVVHWKRGTADFADCLIERSAAAGGCDSTVTFDRAAAKHAGMRLL
jgi:predicted nucleic-acid-binding protein